MTLETRSENKPVDSARADGHCRFPCTEISDFFLLLQHSALQELVQVYSPAPYVVANMMEETHAISP